MEEIFKAENRIWKHRTAKGLKQSELAFLIGQGNSSQISRYERGLVIPKLEKLIKLCFCLGTDIEYLYPELIQRWRKESEIKIQKLKKTEKHVA